MGEATVDSLLALVLPRRIWGRLVLFGPRKHSLHSHWSDKAPTLHVAGCPVASAVQLHLLFSMFCGGDLWSRSSREKNRNTKRLQVQCPGQVWKNPGVSRLLDLHDRLHRPFLRTSHLVDSGLCQDSSRNFPRWKRPRSHPILKITPFIHFPATYLLTYITS